MKDRDRPLRPRGISAAVLMARYMAEQGWRGDYLLSSNALRAFTTANVIAESLDHRARAIHVDERLYRKGARAILNILRELPETKSSVILIAHKPELKILLQLLTGHEIDKFACATVACIEQPISNWSGLEQGCGSLRVLAWLKKNKVMRLSPTRITPTNSSLASFR